MKGFNDYLLPLILAGLATLLVFLTFPTLGVYPLHFLAVIVASYFGRTHSALIASLASVLFIWVFIPVERTTIDLAFTSMVFVIVGVLSSVLARRQMTLARQYTELQSRSRQLADHHADAIITIDENSDIDYANESAAKLFGYPKEDLVKMNMTELMPVRLRERHKEGFGRYLKTGKRTLDWAGVRMDALHSTGKEFRIAISFGEMMVEDRHLFTAFIRDVTLEEQQQRLLKEANERYETLIKNSEDAIWRLEFFEPVPIGLPVQKQVDLILNTVYLAEGNDAVARLFNAPDLKDIIGRRLLSIVPEQPDSREKTIAFINDGYKSSSQTQREEADGLHYFISTTTGVIEDNKLVRIWGINRDITEDKMAEMALRESEQRFRLVTESVRDHAIISLDASGIIKTWNIGAERVYGYSADEIIGKSITLLFPDGVDKEAKLQEELAIALKNGKWEGEEIRIHKDGRQLNISITITPLLGGDGELLWYGKVDRDITERVNFIRQLEEKNEELVAVNRSKDQFLATLSHELRTPLVSILGYANMLATAKLAPEAQSRAIEVIARNTRLQVDLIEDLLDVSRIIAGKISLQKEDVPICSLLTEVIETFRPQAQEKGITISLTFLQKDIVVSCDRRRVSQIFINLMSNAVKFTESGGTIDVVLGKVDPNGFILVSIKDTGIGISETLMPHLFERFKQADSSSTRKYSGLGLGLSIVKQLVDMHEGQVWAESEGEGKGSTFFVNLCCAKNDPAKSFENKEAPKIEAPVINLEGVKILIVDDDSDTRHMLEDYFHRFKAVVFTAHSAKSAREVAEEKKPDIFILDIGMPDEDGYALVKSLREMGYKNPALALTAFVGKEYEEAALKAGFDAYIPKPASLTYLLRKVQDLKGTIVSLTVEVKELKEDRTKVALETSEIAEGLAAEKTNLAIKTAEDAKVLKEESDEIISDLKGQVEKLENRDKKE